jgi:hypothetical protein
MINFETLVSEYKNQPTRTWEHTPRYWSSPEGYYLAPKYDVVRREPFIEVGLERCYLAVFEGGLIRLKYSGHLLPYKHGQEDLKVLNRFGLNIHSTRYIDSSDFSLPDPLVQQGEIFKGKKPVFKKAHISNGAIFVINKGKAYLGRPSSKYGRDGQIEWENGEVGGVKDWTTSPPDRPKRAAARKLLGEIKDLLPAFGFMHDERLKYLRSEGRRVWRMIEPLSSEVTELLDTAPEAQFLFERAMVVLGQDHNQDSDVIDLLAFGIFMNMHTSYAQKSLIDRFSHFNEEHKYPYLIVKEKENDAL